MIEGTAQTTSKEPMNEWKRGLPPGKMTKDNKQWFLDTYEVYFTPIGAVWHRKKESNEVRT